MSIQRFGTGPANYTICTSGGRPASPVEGSLIYETDTNRMYYYDGTNWRIVTPQMIAKAKRTTGDVSITSSVSSVDTALDRTVPCVAGDRVNLYLNCLMAAPAANNLYLDVVTVNNTTETNYVSGTTFTSAGQGIAGAFGGSTEQFAMVYTYDVVSGDIFSGSTKFRIKAKTNSGTGTIYGQTDYPLVFWAINMGEMA